MLYTHDSHPHQVPSGEDQADLSSPESKKAETDSFAQDSASSEKPIKASSSQEETAAPQSADKAEDVEQAEDIEIPTVGDLMYSEAQAVVRGNVIAAMALGLVPVPVVDIVAVAGISVQMTYGLSNIYGIPFSQEAARAALFSIVPAALPVTMMSAGASLLKSIPGVGSLAGAGGVSLLSGAVVYALGQVLIRHYEKGGTLNDINFDLARRQFKSKLEEGRRFAADLRKQSKSDDASGTPSPAQSEAAVAVNAAVKKPSS